MASACCDDVYHQAGGEFLCGTLWQRSQVHSANDTLS